MNHSDNLASADNQQERLAQWIVGFVDGEGTFSVSLIRNATTTLGYQVFPEFVITQGARSVHVLHDVRDYFGCGKVYENRRHDNHRESLYRYVVRSLGDLTTTIVPFFERHQLRTAKRSDFHHFCEVVQMMTERKHLDSASEPLIRSIMDKMNRRASILRDHTPESVSTDKI